MLSTAYQYGNPTRVVEHEYEKVKAENDWTSQQVALYPDRLRAFGISHMKVIAAIENANRESGGSVLEMAGRATM